MKVKLMDVMEAIELNADEFVYYYNKETGEIVMRADPVATGLLDEELEDELEENWENYIPLPTEYQIDEYKMMGNFIWELPDHKSQEILERAIQGRGAFRRFKDRLCALGLEKKWYEYRDKAYRDIAIEWCEENEVEYF